MGGCPTAPHGISAIGGPLGLGCAIPLLANGKGATERRTFLQSLFSRRVLVDLAGGRRRRQGAEAEQLRFRVTGAVVRRGIHESVGRHDAVKATAPNPMMNIPILLVKIHKFDAGPRGHKILLGGFGNVTAMMKPVGINIRPKLALDRSVAKLTPGKHARVRRARQRRRPNQTARHEQILRRLISAPAMRSFPQRFPIGNGERLHAPVPAREQNDAVMNDQFGTEVHRKLFPPRRRLRGPQQRAAGPVQAHQLVAVVKEHASVVNGESQRRDDGRMLP